MSEQAKFLLRMNPQLRHDIKREARKQGVSMNDYILIVVQQFIEMNKRNRPWTEKH